MQANTKSNKEKMIDKLQNKIRVLERKVNGQQAEYDKVTTKTKSENQQLEERLETVKKMNFQLQKKLKTAKEKAEQYDAVLSRCIQLEETNQELLRIVTSGGQPLPAGLMSVSVLANEDDL